MQQSLQHTLQFIVQQEEEGVLKAFLLQHKQISRKSLSQIKHAGQLLLNHVPVTVRTMVKQGDLVEVVFPVEEESEYLFPQDIPLDIIYEDEYILLVNKQPDLVVHPTFSQKEGTLANGVLYYWQQKGWKRTFHAVNRLDKDTTGLVLLAQNKYSHQQLSIQQKKKKLIRKYYAFVHGRVEQDQGEIVAPIGRKPDSIIERAVVADGSYAKTFYKVVKRFSDYTWVEIQLETGRTHQIRVHFAYLGHPLLGDDLYGGKRELITRQALHAFYTQFTHPLTGEMMEFRAPLPLDLKQLIELKKDPL